MRIHEGSKFRWTLIVALLLCVLMVVLPSCGTRLNGVYQSTSLLGEKFTFSGDTVTISAFGINATGTYVISENQITITYRLLGLSYDWTETFSRSGKSIYIGGVEFVKQS